MSVGGGFVVVTTITCGWFLDFGSEFFGLSAVEGGASCEFGTLQSFSEESCLVVVFRGLV